MAEARIFAEGTLRCVQASGSGRTWATASAPTSALFGYVQEGFTFTSGRAVITIFERGVPDHHKVTQKEVINGSFTMQWTGSIPSAVSGSGASVPMWHLEHKAAAPENGGTGVYHQLHGVVVQSIGFTEGSPNTVNVSFVALAMNGPTGSGYLS
jgi:predicted membrane GTPase involved in stress response